MILRGKLLYVLIITCNFQLVTFNLFAQPTQEWVARYQSPTGISGIANKMALDKVGNCYIFGEYLNFTNQVLLIKYNSAGDTLWVKRIQSVVNDIPYGVIADSIGNSWITYSSGVNFGPYDVITIKYNPQGVQQWIKTYDSGLNDEPRNIAMDRQGNVYIGGIRGDESLIIKYKSSGDTLWTRKYTEPGFRFPSKTISVDNRDNVYIGGGKINMSTGSQNYYTIKYDSSGNFKWVVSYTINGIAVLNKIRIDMNYNVFVTGSSFNAKMLTIKYDSNGTEQWQRVYDGTGLGADVAYDMEIDNSGNAIVTGSSSGSGTGSSDYVTIKYNTIGDSVWVRRYNGTGNGNDESYSLSLDDSDNIYITGRSIGNFSDWDYATIKYNTLGVQQWLMRYPNLVNSGGIAYVIAVDKFQNIYVTGKSDSGGPSGYVTIKYSQPVSGIMPINGNIPSSFRIYQNYPNPFNPNTIIRFQIPKSSNTKLAIYDVLGREILVLVNEYIKAGEYKINFDASSLATGIYFYSIKTNDFTETKRMVLIK